MTEKRISKAPKNDRGSLKLLGGFTGTVAYQAFLTAPRRGLFKLCRLGGSGVMEEGRNLWHLPEGSVLLIRPGLSFTLKACGSPLRIDQLTAAGAVPAGYGGGACAFAPLKGVPGGAAPLFDSLLERMPCDGGGTLLQSLLLRIAAETYPLTPEGAGPPESVLALRRMLDTRYMEKLTLDSLAGELHWNKFKLEKDFKRYYACTPFEYLLNVRVEEACRLLRETKDSVLKIGFAVGVDNASYFIRLFRSRVGMSPLAYREHGPELVENEKKV